MRKSGPGGLVYSTETGRTCPVCRNALDACVCASRAATVASGDGVVRVSREKAGRGGKVVTVVRGVPVDALALAMLGKTLRTACGAGGTVRDGVIEVQGDHCERVIAHLEKAGYKTKRAGG